MMTFKKILKVTLLRSIKNFYRCVRDLFTWDQWSVRSWSQEGEDLILNRLLKRKSIGFYVDVGAHHPRRFSNTYLFYRRGWHGINIDATPGSMRPFNRLRRRDTNLEIGIDLSPSVLDYYVFNEPALNGFVPELAKERHNSNSPYAIIKVVQVEVKPLSEVLDVYAHGRQIDFLTVDVEGLDLRVLKSNDWKKYRPKVVLAEILAKNYDDLKSDELTAFMVSKDYRLAAKTENTVFFTNNLNTNK